MLTDVIIYYTIYIYKLYERKTDGEAVYMQNFEKKTVEPETFIPILKESVKNGGNVRLRVTGGSMRPFLNSEGDCVILSRANDLKRGDIVFFVRENGQCVLHRIVKIKGGAFFLTGDAQTYKEGPVNRESILAKAVGAVRKGKNIGEKNAVWLFFKHIWIHSIKFRPFLFKLNRRIRGLIR